MMISVNQIEKKKTDFQHYVYNISQVGFPLIKFFFIFFHFHLLCYRILPKIDLIQFHLVNMRSEESQGAETKYVGKKTET